ncbi:MAG: hypothetical protein NT004_05660 [Bacteroidetes bacterium]|nr:hypothetical protein [Bacteroidota bacterium]
MAENILFNWEFTRLPVFFYLGFHIPDDLLKELSYRKKKKKEGM